MKNKVKDRIFSTDGSDKKRKLFPFYISFFLIILITLAQFFYVLKHMDSWHKIDLKFKICNLTFLGFNFIFAIFIEFLVLNFLVGCFFGFINLRKRTQKLDLLNRSVVMPSSLPKVVLIHMTCNDFLPERAKQCLNQDYSVVDYYICDDSTDEKIIKEIDDFSVKHNCKIWRRKNTDKEKATRAGNWKNFVDMFENKYEYVVFTDSGTVLESDFISKNIRFFYTKNNNNLAYVHCWHCSYPNKNLFSIMNNHFEEVMCLHLYLRDEYFFSLNTGFGVIYKTSILKQVPLEKVNLSVDDDATCKYLYSIGYYGLYSPFSRTSKCRPFDPYSFFIQQYKWINGNFDEVLRNKTISLSNQKYLSKVSIFILFLFQYMPFFFALFAVIWPIISNLFYLIFLTSCYDSQFVNENIIWLLLNQNFAIYIPSVVLGIVYILFCSFVLNKKNILRALWNGIYVILTSTMILCLVTSCFIRRIFLMQKHIKFPRQTTKAYSPMSKWNLTKRLFCMILIPFFSIASSTILSIIFIIDFGNISVWTFITLFVQNAIMILGLIIMFVIYFKSNKIVLPTYNEKSPIDIKKYMKLDRIVETDSKKEEYVKKE